MLGPSFRHAFKKIELSVECIGYETILIDNLNTPAYSIGVRGGAVGRGTALQNRKVAGSIPDGVAGIFQ
jgi:hypothetical protein